MNTKRRLQRYMQEVREAGRREMSAAVGVSHVMTGRLVRELEEEGILKACGMGSSGGGRPEVRYRYNGAHGTVILFRLEEEDSAHRGILEQLDMNGRVLEEKSARFTHLQAEMLDDWLDELTHRWRRKPQRIVLHLPEGLLARELAAHLQQRCTIPVKRLNTAEALADKRPHTLTLLCRQGMPPQAAYRSEAELLPCNYLHMLPLPDRWETMDYSDHTLTEEMICRLIQSLTCVLGQERVELYCDYLTERLIPRIRYNLSAKLKGMERMPRLHFRSISEDKLTEAVHRAAVRYA